MDFGQNSLFGYMEDLQELTIIERPVRRSLKPLFPGPFLDAARLFSRTLSPGTGPGPPREPLSPGPGLPPGVLRGRRGPRGAPPPPCRGCPAARAVPAAAASSPRPGSAAPVLAPVPEPQLLLSPDAHPLRTLTPGELKLGPLSPGQPFLPSRSSQHRSRSPPNPSLPS
ncbi:Hypothetical predicted protein [Marmota monax]|uniref:Uncharacterized protein n=1 Tax=Marmota monax TaxID=9995 RepID=A0A5E4BZ69_MARMO|nr:hypothetical protein GHT09_001638 [Marmota monax]VTJ74546.1 Hypothetical predicted protein [Marmota monax]